MTQCVSAAQPPSYPTSSSYYGHGSYGGGANGNGRVGKFVGLSNQGATCYMNSLLQTLYMTPEFRAAIYKWTYDPERDGAEEYSIPLQLQRLFGYLQLSDSRSVDTKALTKSFGWEGSEVFQQQDVQELCRVLFDALEESFKHHAGDQQQHGEEKEERVTAADSDMANVIDELYAGEHIDYVNCLDIDYISERKDKFLDISLAIKPFGSTRVMKSLIECLEYYLQPEILDGDNKYYCETVEKKVDAIKGLKISKLPQIMSVQLKRFVFDFSGDHVVQKKINEEVKFPIVLDLNRYVCNTSKRMRSMSMEVNKDLKLMSGEEKHEIMSASSDAEKTEESTDDEFESFLRKRIAEMRSNRQSSTNLVSLDIVEPDDYDVDMPDLVDCNGQLCPAQQQEQDLKLKQLKEEEKIYDRNIDAQELIRLRGEWVYELYAVLVHSGAISGGHYYVYIRDQETGKWWNFNDASVTEISIDRVYEAWGGATTFTNYFGTQSTYQSSANAYMLMYRKVTPRDNRDRDASFNINDGVRKCYPSDDMVPAFIKEEINNAKEVARQRQLEEEERLSKVSLRIHYKGKEHTVEMNKKQTYLQLLQKIWHDLKIYEDEIFDGMSAEDEMPVNRIRLRNYNNYFKMAQEIYNVEVAGSSSIDLLAFGYRELIVDLRSADEEWEKYDTSAHIYLVNFYDPVKHCLKEPVPVRISLPATLGKLRDACRKHFPPQTDLSTLRFIRIQTENRVEELVGDTNLLSDFHMFDNSRVYCEINNSSPITQSNCYQLYIESLNKFQIHVNYPGKPEDMRLIFVDKRWTLKKLRAHLASELKVEENSFRMFKKHGNDQEINNEEDTLLPALYIYSGTTLQLVPGTPLAPGHFLFKTYIYTSEYVPGVVNIEDISLEDGDGNSRDGVHDRGLPPEYSHLLKDDAHISSAHFRKQDMHGHVNGNEYSVEDDVGGEDHVIQATIAQLTPSMDDSMEVNLDDIQPTIVTASLITELVPNDVAGGAPPASPVTTAPTTEITSPSRNQANNEVEEMTKFGYKVIDLQASKESFTFLMDIDIHNQTLISEIQTQVYEELASRNLLPEYAVNPNYIRIRQKNHLRPGVMLVAGTIQQNQISTHSLREFSIQILNHEEHLTPPRDGDVIILTQKWIRSTWSLSPRMEVRLRGYMSVNDIATRLAQLFNISPSSNALVYILNQYSDVKLCDLDKESGTYGKAWMSPFGEERALVKTGWSLKEGDLIIIQDTSEPLKKLSEIELKSIEEAKFHSGMDCYSGSYGSYGSHIPSWLNSSTTSVTTPSSNGSQTTSYTMPREQGIQIKTQAKREREKQLAQENSNSSTNLVLLGKSASSNALAVDEHDHAPLFADVN